MKRNAKTNVYVDIEAVRKKYLLRKVEYETLGVTNHIEYEKIVKWLNENNITKRNK